MSYMCTSVNKTLNASIINYMCYLMCSYIMKYCIIFSVFYEFILPVRLSGEADANTRLARLHIKTK